MPSLRPLLALAVLCATPVAAQSDAERARALQGAWSFVEASNPRTFEVVTNQPGMRLFVDGHYSDVHVNGTRPRAAVDSTSTALALWNTYGRGLTAQSGTYEVRGDTLITRASVAKNPGAMAAGTFNRFLHRIAGDSLWLTFTESQAGPAATPATAFFVRVRAPAMPTN
jgi:hypothetical protein